MATLLFYDSIADEFRGIHAASKNAADIQIRIGTLELSCVGVEARADRTGDQISQFAFQYLKEGRTEAVDPINFTEADLDAAKVRWQGNWY